MDIARKLELAQQAIRSISTHDDEPRSEVETALDQLSEFIFSEKAAGSERRAKALEEAKRKAREDDERETMTITAADVGTINAADLNG